MTSQFLNSTFNSSDSMETAPFQRCGANNEGVVFWACSSIFSSLFGLPACVLVLWELFQKHRRGTPTTPNDVFMLNLTVMDFSFLFSMFVGQCNLFLWFNTPLGLLCNFLYAFSVSGRPLFMTCICLDCYLAVVHPILYRARKGLTSRVLMSICVWAVTLAYGIALSIVKDFFYSFFTLVAYIIALPTIGFCDFFILRALKSSDPAGRDLHPQKKKALQIIINSLVMTVIAYLPPVFLYSIRLLLLDFKYSSCIIVTLVLLTSTSGSAVMPILYLNNLGKLNSWVERCKHFGVKTPTLTC